MPSRCSRSTFSSCPWALTSAAAGGTAWTSPEAFSTVFSLRPLETKKKSLLLFLQHYDNIISRVREGVVLFVYVWPELSKRTGLLHYFGHFAPRFVPSRHLFARLHAPVVQHGPPLDLGDQLFLHVIVVAGPPPPSPFLSPRYGCCCVGMSLVRRRRRRRCRRFHRLLLPSVGAIVVFQ